MVLLNILLLGLVIVGRLVLLQRSGTSTVKEVDGYSRGATTVAGLQGTVEVGQEVYLVSVLE